MVHAPGATASRCRHAADGAPATLLRKHPVEVGQGDAIQRPQLSIAPVLTVPVVNPAVSADREPGPVSDGTAALPAGPQWRFLTAAAALCPVPLFLAASRAELPVRATPGGIRELRRAVQADEHRFALRWFPALIVAGLAFGRVAVAAMRRPAELI